MKGPFLSTLEMWAKGHGAPPALGLGHETGLRKAACLASDVVAPPPLRWTWDPLEQAAVSC